MANSADSNTPIDNSSILQPLAPPATFDASFSCFGSTTDPVVYVAPGLDDNTRKDDHTITLNSSIIASSLSSTMVSTLKEEGYTTGLINALWETRKIFPLRIWIVDNSGSMRSSDGTRIITDSSNSKTTIIRNATRWEEMQQTVHCQAKLAACLEAPTVFRLLNDPGAEVGPQQFSIGLNGSASIPQELSLALSTIQNAAPGGVTPLVEHLQEIRRNVLALESELRQSGTKVSITIATDGLPSDQMGLSSDEIMREFEQTLRSMESLPIWLVVRLFTGEENVVKFWNDLDSKLELSIEVLDDFLSEATELFNCNKWINYSLPLHRMREFGFKNYIFDFLDERKLSKSEIRQFCRILFGQSEMDEAPDADIDWNGFCKVLERVNTQEKPQWNSIRSKVEPWIDMKALNNHVMGKDIGTNSSMAQCCVIM